MIKKSKHPGGGGGTVNHVVFWIQGTESLIKIAILFFRERYIDGGEEPLIATVEGDTDPVGKGIFEKPSKRKKKVG